MKARQKRRDRRVNHVVSGIDNAALNGIKKRLDELQVPIAPADGLTEISGQLDRIERRMDSIEAAAVRQGAIAGSVAGGITGGLVTTTILLIKARLGL
ncbi:MULTISPECIES: hypothetical protein [Brenneria]|uniref:Uncharacterized protein n=1 Tax=Brenneria nigrifluens DSM 30175 = ATCC 13028 TaxID=1121120 RepID=A0A2U1USS2_9GAMM|nr:MULTISPECIES: hypothetical protein [Brenneria]EHD21540.1 hypothetical protein BrE312_2157 [Brenneria sp. EniD312]PWC24674.1 hypothetical protein DDT54_08275 [Brenneria nigrifluens DSM 30175 = ATCC 13028]QCR04661.1 hypothetical protein EH206_11050 [Brenneria nigrifluens DSM 30175 = ATCC 13028]